jgi:hypothetical protein
MSANLPPLPLAARRRTTSYRHMGCSVPACQCDGWIAEESACYAVAGDPDADGSGSGVVRPVRRKECQAAVVVRASMASRADS